MKTEQKITLTEVWNIAEHDDHVCCLCSRPARPSYDNPGFNFTISNSRVCADCAVNRGFTVDKDLLSRILRAYWGREKS